jgi:hypothetical protein
LTLAGVLVQIVTTHVTDQQILTKIAADLQALIEPNGPPSRPVLQVVR